MIYDTVDQILVDLFLYLSKYYICLYNSLFLLSLFLVQFSFHHLASKQIPRIFFHAPSKIIHHLIHVHKYFHSTNAQNNFCVIVSKIKLRLQQTIEKAESLESLILKKMLSIYIIILRQ